MPNRQSIPTVVALGGGGFDADNPEGAPLDRWLVNRAGGGAPHVCLIPTAGGDSEFRIARFRRAAEAVGAIPRELCLYRPPTRDFTSYLHECDLVFVSGGSTKNLLALWRDWGLDADLRTAYESGVLLAGVSAGANCWFESCSTDSFFGDLELIPCLGWFAGCFLPHFTGEPLRRPHLDLLLKQGTIDQGWAVDDLAAVVMESGAYAGSISAGGRVWRLENGELREQLVSSVSSPG